MEHEIDNL